MREFFASLTATKPPVKSWTEIHRAMLQLKADADAYQAANRNPLADGYSDAVAGLCDALSDASVEFESEAEADRPVNRNRPGHMVPDRHKGEV